MLLVLPDRGRKRLIEFHMWDAGRLLVLALVCQRLEREGYFRNRVGIQCTGGVEEQTQGQSHVHHPLSGT